MAAILFTDKRLGIEKVVAQEITVSLQVGEKGMGNYRLPLHLTLQG